MKLFLIVLFTFSFSAHTCFAQVTSAPRTQITQEEQELLDQGEIGTGQYIAGGIVGTFLGLGIGNAIEGTYMPKGLIFTLGELGGATMMVTGAVDCAVDAIGASITNSSVTCHTTAYTIGAVVLVGLRIWEIIDVWATPPSINHRIESIRARTGMSAPRAAIIPLMDPTHGSVNGAQLALSFQF